MKKGIIIAAIILASIAALLPFKEFSAPISHTCGGNQLKSKRAYWLYDWVTTEKPQGFVACVGSSTVLVYRAFDISAVLIILSVSLLSYISLKK